jgi:hypothetical protein
MATWEGATSGNVSEVGEAARSPAHVVTMPKKGNWYRYSGFTGTIGAALGAASEIVQFRFLSGTKVYALVQKIEFEGMGIVAVATAVGPLGFEAVPARAWTTVGSGGTRISVALNNLKVETGLPPSQVNDIGISTTGALTAGTKTLDANAMGGVLGGIGTGAATIYGDTSIIRPGDLMSSYGDIPLVCANQEGFVIRTTHVGPAGLTYVARFSNTWVEVTVFLNRGVLTNGYSY